MLDSIQIKIATWSLLLIPIVGVIGLIYHLGHVAGANEVQTQWDAANKVIAGQRAALVSDFKQKESAQRQQAAQISDQLRKAEDDHTIAIAALNADFAQRMRASAERAGVYQRLAEAGSAQCADLAGHTAELDRALEQGVELVGELSATLGQHDTDLKLVGQQLINDRTVVGTTQ